MTAQDDSFDDLLRAVASAPPVSPQALASAAGSLVGQRLGHFYVEALLGRGGMGAVYRARDERLSRTVALKVLTGLAALDAGATSALLAEAKSAAAVSHRAIAQVYDVGAIDGVAFIAMEHVEGETLRSRLARGPLAAGAALEIARAVTAAIARAHEAGVVHLDLKPDNVMLDAEGEPKVLDFGLARPIEVAAAERGIVRGTPGYMAPEQVAGRGAGPAADVYALGATLRELFARTTRAPRGLNEVVLRCLEADPARRFADAGELSAALERVATAAERRAVLLRRAALAAAAAAGLGAALVALRAARAPSPLAPTTALRRLTANVPEVPIVHAALSPDGARLAYADHAGLHVARIGAAEVRDVPVPDGAEPALVAWAPDGRALYVVVGAGEAPRTLLRVGLGGDTRRVADGAFTGIAVSPDGARVAFAETRRVGWLDAGGARHVLVEKPAGCSVSELGWSPHGARLAYATICYGSLGDAAIESVAAEGGEPVRVVADPRLFNDAARAGLLWSRRGDVVYALAEWLPAESGSNLWSVAVDEATGRAAAAPRALTSWVGASASALSEDRAGEKIAFVRSELQSDVYVGELSESGARMETPRRLTLSDRNERPATWSRDGESLYFFSDRTGGFDLFEQPVDGGAARAVAAEPSWETLAQLAPRGDALLYWRFPPARAGEAVRPELVRRPLDGSAPPAVVLGARGVSHPAGVGRPQPWEMRLRCPRAPSAACVLSEREGDAVVFSAVDPVAGRGAELLRLEHASRATNLWDVSPDGARLALPRPDGAVRVHDLAGGDRDLDVVPDCDTLVPTWSADGETLFVSMECETAPEFRIYAKRLAGPVTLLWADPPHYLLETEASPDGRRLAIAVKRTDNDVWMFDRP